MTSLQSARGRGAERILDLVEWMAGQVAPFGLADAAQSMATSKSSMLLLRTALAQPALPMSAA